MLNTRENVPRDRSKLFLQQGVFSKAEKVMNYVNPEPRNRWIRKQSQSDLRQQMYDHEQNFDNMPSYQEPRYSQHLNPFSSRRDEHDQEDISPENSALRAHNYHNNNSSRPSFIPVPDTKSNYLIPQQQQQRQPPKTASKSPAAIRKSNPQIYSQKSNRSSVKEKPTRLSYSKNSAVDETIIAQKENMNPQNFTFMRSPSLAAVNVQSDSKEHETQVEDLNSKSSLRFNPAYLSFATNVRQGKETQTRERTRKV